MCIRDRSWGCATRNGDRLFVHIMNAEAPLIYVPVNEEVVSAVNFADRKPVTMRREKSGGVTLIFDKTPEGIDHIVELKLKSSK